MAPTGVLSSWDTLATKSRRTRSTRRSRVRSSTSASTRVEDSGAIRTVTCRGVAWWRAISSSVSRIWPSRRTSATSSASSADIRLVPETRPIAYAGALAFSHGVVGADDHRAAAQDRQHGGDAGGHGGLVHHRKGALLPLAHVPREHATTRHERSDERREEGLRGRVHTMIVRSGSPATRPRDGLSTTVHRPFTACPRLVTRRPYCPSHA